MSHRFFFTGRAAAAALAFLTVLPLHSLNYTVRNDDTLFGLALEYDVPQSWIMRANGLEDSRLRVGQQLEIPVEGPVSVTVMAGDTLSALALLFGVSVDDIMDANSLTSATLKVGQELSIPEPVPEGSYRVRTGDTLTGIALKFNLPLSSLKAYNALSDDIIHPGDRLVVVGDHPDTRIVGPGESLWTIADEYGLTMNDLREWNDISGNVIHPGDLLVLYPGIDATRAAAPDTGMQGTADIALASVKTERPADSGRNSSASISDYADIPRFGEYFYSRPKADDQPNDSYWEESDASTLTDYRRALKLMEMFDTEIASMPRISNALAGWHIVIDPGHGGLDPGAIVTVNDGSGNPLTVTEDEYAYDVALRIYRTLKRHGASVSLTTLAPDHLIRNGENARQTFVHRKNEVYADEAHNGNERWRPVGTVEGLDMRKTIAAEQISGTAALARRKGTLFISIHADNSPDLPAGRAVLFDGMDDEEKQDSRSFASVLAANLGAGSFIKEQNLRVLRGNPADAAVLVEMRNIHYDRNCWALRSSELREQDALMVIDGILDWAGR